MPKLWYSCPSLVNMRLQVVCVLLLAVSLSEGLHATSCSSSIPPPANNATYRMTHNYPSGCHGSKCTYILGIGTNKNRDYLDFSVNANTDAWAAVGFSKTANMFDTNAVGCVIYSGDDHPTVVDTWNPSSPTRNNILNSDQDVVCAHSTEYSNGRVSCIFSRLIAGSASNSDYDLDGDYYMLFGFGDTTQPDKTKAFTFHQDTPQVSPHKVNPVNDSGAVEADLFQDKMIRTHGILMVFAYPLLAGVGIFFSAWMKPVLPKGRWFQVHRFFMIASLLVALVSFMIVFVAHKNESYNGYIGLIDLSNPTGAVHFSIGVLVIVFHLANPLIALVRCKPDSSSRWIFNLLHGKLIGYLCKFLAAVNIGIGISLALSVNNAAFIVYLGFVGYELFLYGVLCVIVLVAKYFLSGYKMVDNGKETLINEKNIGQDTKVSPAIWAGLVLFLVTVVPVTIALAVLIGVEQLQDS